jgi:hypothetical protein
MSSPYVTLLLRAVISQTLSASYFTAFYTKTLQSLPVCPLRSVCLAVANILYKVQHRSAVRRWTLHGLINAASYFSLSTGLCYKNCLNIMVNNKRACQHTT